MTKLKSIMSKKVYSGNPLETAREIANRMRRHNIGALVILVKNRMVGVISERDLVNRVICVGKDPNRTFANDIMTKNVITAKPDMTVGSAAKLMTKRNIKKLPIVSKDKIVGMVTQTDLTKIITEK